MKNFKRSDRRFLISIGTFSLLLLGCAWWWNAFNAMPQVTIPNPKMPSPNAFDIYAKAYLSYTVRPLSLYEDYDAKAQNIETNRVKTWEQQLPFYRTPEIQKWLAGNQGALKLLRQGFKYEYLQPPARSFMTMFPHFAKAREMARTLDTEGNIRAAQGNWSGAADSALDAIHLGHAIPRGGALIASLVGYAIQAIGQKQLQNVLPHLDATTCRAAAKRLEELYGNRVPFDVVLTEDKWTTQASLLEIMQQQNWIKSLYQMRGSPSPLKFRFYSKQRLMSDYTSHIDAQIAAAKQPYAKANSPQEPTDPLLDSFIVSFGRARWSAARVETKNTLLIVALALRAYKLEHGAYPEKLDALVPNYLQEIPTDPFGSGEPLRYKKQATNYKLWSIGSDKKDDGGIFAILPGFKRPQEAEAKQKKFTRFYLMLPDSKGDFVFGINH